MSAPTEASGGKPRRWLLRALLVTLAGLAAGLAPPGAPAQAYWTGPPSGSGTATVATFPAAPAVSVPHYSSGSVAVSWTAVAGPGGAPLTGYYVTETSGTVTSPACGTNPATGTYLTGTSCTDTEPAGTYTYTVVAVFRSWTSASTPSQTVTVDTTAPVFGAFNFAATGNAYYPGTGTTVYYNGEAPAASSIDVTANVTDPGSGIAQVNFPTPTGFAGGGSETTAPYLATYTWSAGTSTSGTQTVTATDNAGLASSASFSLVDDTTPPGGGALKVNGTAASAAGTASWAKTTSFTIGSRTNYTDAGSGLASSVLTVQSETLSGGVCGAPGSGGPFSTPVTVTGTTQPTGITTGFCYLYTLTGTDNVGNTATVSTVVQVDTTAPVFGAFTFSASGPYVYYSGSGSTVYYNGNAGAGSSFTVTASVTDAESGIASVLFPTLSGFVGGGTDTTSPYTATYTWTSSTASGSQTVKATDGAGNTATATFTLKDDTTAPSDGALTVNGTAAASPGTSSSTSSATFTIGSRTNYTDSGSGLASSVLTVQSETLSGGACGTPGSGGPFATPVTVTGTTQPSGIRTGFCYLYTLTGTDHVDNVAAISTTVTVT